MSDNLEILDFSWQEESPLESVNQKRQTLNSESALLLESNLSRRYLLITNVSEHLAYITFGASASQISGLPLHPGGCFESNYSIFPYVGEISGISSVGNATLAIVEGV